jgi:MYXO-CTERM domain-containing protein
LLDSVTLTRTYSAVPEPSAIVLAAMGLVGLLGYAWRRRK